MSIKDEDGNLVTSATNIGNLNKIRYRGYYYDDETGFYYLISRYYNPEVGRFLNADGYISTGTGLLGHNMYTYCGNNPVNYTDSTGSCYFNSRGQWCHDNWEYVTGYDRKPDPRLQDNVLKSVATTQTYLSGAVNFMYDKSSTALQFVDRPANEGKGTFEKKQAAAQKKIDATYAPISKWLDNWEYMNAIAEATFNGINNLISGRNWWKIVWDFSVDATILVTNVYMTSTIVAAVLPAGTAAIAVFAAGYAIDAVLSYVGDGARKELKAWIN